MTPRTVDCEDCPLYAIGTGPVTAECLARGHQLHSRHEVWIHSSQDNWHGRTPRRTVTVALMIVAAGCLTLAASSLAFPVPPLSNLGPLALLPVGAMLWATVVLLGVIAG